MNLLANVLARQDATEKGFDEAILVDDAGWITEGAGSAFFAIRDALAHNGRPDLQAPATPEAVLRALGGAGRE